MASGITKAAIPSVFWIECWCNGIDTSAITKVDKFSFLSNKRYDVLGKLLSYSSAGTNFVLCAWLPIFFSFVVSQLNPELVFNAQFRHDLMVPPLLLTNNAD